MITAHPAVDAVIYLGLGIQSNEARLMREGGFHPGHGLDRIVAYHERQDQRFAEAADELSRRYDKPILTATELAVADPANPGPAAVRATGRLCYRQRQPCRRRAWSISTDTPSSGAAEGWIAGVGLMARSRINPIAVLVVLALIPAVALGGAVALRRCPPATAGRATRCPGSVDVAGTDDHAAAVGSTRAWRAVPPGQRRRVAGRAAAVAGVGRRQPVLRPWRSMASRWRPRTTRSRCRPPAT